MRSRWIFLALALGTALGCLWLGVWQLNRHAARRSANVIASASRSFGFRAYPDSASLAPGIGIIVTGTFDHDREFVLRGRAYHGAPGVEIATPFKVTGTDQAIIVIRGFVPSDDAMSVDLPALREPGVRSVRGGVFPLPLDGTPIVRNGDTTWSRIPGTFIQANFPYHVADFALWQEKDSGMTGMPIRLGAPELSTGPHFNYALQWFAFALIFGVGGGIFVFRRPHPPIPSPLDLTLRPPLL